ncbi:MAG: AtpZ/AtpI family protein [Candidatus Microsaccharimonas sp.]
MTESPRPQSKPGRTTKPQSKSSSSVMIIFVTALDTTWRAFLPTLGGVFLGIGIDHWLNIAPIATIACLVLGTVTSALLIAKQLRDVRKPLK